MEQSFSWSLLATSSSCSWWSIEINIEVAGFFIQEREKGKLKPAMASVQEMDGEEGGRAGDEDDRQH